ALAFAAVMLVHVVRPLVLSLATRPATAGLARPVVAVRGVEDAAQLTRENLALTRQNPELAPQLVPAWLQGRAAARRRGDWGGRTSDRGPARRHAAPTLGGGEVRHPAPHARRGRRLRGLPAPDRDRGARGLGGDRATPLDPVGAGRLGARG